MENQIGACVFDAYGTLFDTASAALRATELLGDKAPGVAILWRDKQLAYSWLRTIQGLHADFGRVTADALDYALARHGLGDTTLPARLLQLYRRLDCFDDVKPCLTALRQAGHRLAILSNGTKPMLDELVEAAGLSGWFDEILSVDEVGVFKPDRRVYQLAVDRLALPTERIAFISSNGWDAYGGAAFGFKVFWCNRGSQPPEGLPGQPQAMMRSLAELPGLIALSAGAPARSR